VVADLYFAGQFAAAIIGNRAGGGLLSRGFIGGGGAGGRQAGNMHQSLDGPLAGVYRADDIACAELVDFVELRGGLGFVQPAQ